MMDDRRLHAHSISGRVFRLAVLVAFVVTMMPAGLVAAPSAAVSGPEIHGTVTDIHDTQGVTGAYVTAYHMAWAPWQGGGPRISDTVMTDVAGGYSIPNPFDEYTYRPGEEDFWVEVFANGYYNESTPNFEWDGIGSKQVDVALAHAGNLKVVGTVLDIDTDAPIAGVQVGSGWEVGADHFYQTRISDIVGEFELQGVPNGTEFFVNAGGWGTEYEEYGKTFYFEGPDVLNIQVHLRKADPRFWVDPVNNWLQGDNWPASSEVTITVGNLGDPDFEMRVQTHGFGGFGYWIDPTQYDVAPGDTVTVRDDATTKVHVVSDLSVTDIDFAADTVSGVGTPLADLTVWLTDHYGMLDPFDWIPADIQADALGAWTADFSYEFDITDRTGGEVFEWDEDHDATRIAWGFDPENPGPMLPVEGADRFATAIEAARLAYPHYAETVVIATGMNWPDALGGTALAGAVDGPILLTRPDVLPAAVLAEIQRLGASNAIILGGEVAVHAAVETALNTALGAENVDRIAGSDRYDTANQIALEVIEVLGAEYDGTAFVATGGNFPDALAAAPLAAAQKWPLYLAHPTTGLSGATVGAMAGVDNVLILGGEGVVSSTVEQSIQMLVTLDIERLWGPDRFGTAVAVANHAVDKAGHMWNRVGITTGMDFPDALAGGVLQGKMDSVMLLTWPDRLADPAQTALSANAEAIDAVTFFGGTVAVESAVRDAALAGAGLTP